MYASPLLVLVLVASVAYGISYQNKYSVAWDPPNGQAMQQLQWVAQHYGYDNKTVILVIYGFNNYLWALALTGVPMYYGHLGYLLSNKTETALVNSPSSANGSAYIGAMQVLWVDGAIPSFHPNRYTILLTSGTYSLTPQEIQILRNVGPGVYSVPNLPGPSLQQWVIEWCSFDQCK